MQDPGPIHRANAEEKQKGQVVCGICGFSLDEVGECPRCRLEVKEGAGEQHPSKPETHTTTTTSTTTSSGVYSTVVSGTPEMPSTVTLPPPLQPDKEPWQTFFDEAIDLYVLPDVQRLTYEIRPDNTGPKPGLRGCTIPLAMMLFAVIDLFGFLVRSDSGPDKRDTKGNFCYLLSQSNYFPKTYKDNFDLLLKIYRHGIVHQVFPKVSAIAKAGPECCLMHLQGSTYVLNVDRLSTDVVAAIEQIRQDLTQDLDPQLVTRVNKRLRKFEEEDHKAVSKVQRKGP